MKQPSDNKAAGNGQAIDDAPFLAVFWAFVQQLRGPAEGLTQAKLKESLAVAVRKWTDVPARMASKAALAVAESKGFDLFQLRWSQRLKGGRIGEKGPSALVWEHTTPLGEALKELMQCGSADEVRDWMNGYSGVCWITREEDEELNGKGFRSKRPGGWEACYAKCEIIVVRKEEWHG